MPLKIKERAGVYYLRGTVQAGKRKSGPIFETTGIRVGERGTKARADQIRIRRESEIITELLHGRKATVTWIEAATAYCERRQQHLSQTKPRFDPKAPDDTAGIVLQLTDFFQSRGKDSAPLTSLTKADLNTYFQVRHFDRGNKLSTAKRHETIYKAVMNFAVKEWSFDSNFPKPDLADYDPLKNPVVDKYFEAEEIQWMLSNAQDHFRPILALGIATGRRTGELAFLARPGRYDEATHSGELRLDKGREYLFLGYTKNGDPKITPLPDWVLPILVKSLNERTDRHTVLFLTNRGEPYKRPKQQGGGPFKKTWKTLKLNLALFLLMEARKHPPRSPERQHFIRRSHIVRKSTPHWMRHNAASHLMMNDLSDSGIATHMGWRDPRMIQRYAHMSPSRGKQIANMLDFSVIEGGAKSVQPKKKA